MLRLIVIIFAAANAGFAAYDFASGYNVAGAFAVFASAFGALSVLDAPHDQ